MSDDSKPVVHEEYYDNELTEVDYKQDSKDIRKRYEILEIKLDEVLAKIRQRNQAKKAK